MTTLLTAKALSIRAGNDLKRMLAAADELRIAVGLMNDDGLSALLVACPDDCKLTFLLGVDLPTPSSVFDRVLALGDRATIKVMLNKETFHPKVFIASKGSAHAALVGSGNCTNGGLFSNIEMGLVAEDRETTQQLLDWFDRYYKLASDVTPSWLDSYKGFELQRANIQIQDVADVRVFKTRTGPRHSGFNLKDLDLTGQFFGFEHHNAFSGDKPYSRDSKVVAERAAVSDRLIDLHNLLWPLIKTKNWNVHPHHMDQHITSSVQHSDHTDKDLGAVWLHYGRSEAELNRFAKVYGDEQTSLYHMRLQVLVHDYDVAVWFRVGKRNGSVVDRTAFKRRMDADSSYRQRFFDLIKRLPERFFVRINDERRLVQTFTTPNQLHEFVRQDNIQQYYFIIGTSYSPDDPKLSIDHIVSTVIEDFTWLEPLYQLLRTPAPTN